jgi:hypothetical protein
MGIYDNMGDARNRTSRPAGSPERTDSEYVEAVTTVASTIARNSLPDEGAMTRAGAQTQVAANRQGQWAAPD